MALVSMGPVVGGKRTRGGGGNNGCLHVDVELCSPGDEAR